MIRRSFVPWLLAASLVAAGCRGVLGLDDSSIAEGDAGADAGESGSPANDAALGQGASADGSVLDATGTEGSDAGMETATDAGSDAGPDAWVLPDPHYVAWPLPGDVVAVTDYDVTSDTALSHATGLMWARAPMNAEVTGGEGAQYCAELKTGGFEDWRLPSRVELMTILDFQPTGDVMFDTAVFQEASKGNFGSDWSYYWTTRDKTVLDYDIASPLIAIVDDADHYSIRCVRDGIFRNKVPSPRLVVGEDDVRDVWAKLDWARAPSAAAISYGAAVQACSALQVGGSGGFRVPTMRELLSLPDDARPAGDVDPAVFIRGTAASTWSSTTETRDGGAGAWTLLEATGKASLADAQGTALARCVRALP